MTNSLLTDPAEVEVILAGAGWVRDTQVCACGHRCATHGSTEGGIGTGECGWDVCDCQLFVGTWNYSTEPILPTQEERNYAVLIGRVAS